MSFSLDWLDLREAADHAARARSLLDAAAAFAEAHPATIVDLGAGSGSTVRAFGARAKASRWRLVDRDPALLRAAQRRHPLAEVCEADLAAIEALPLQGARLVTASALVDLVSAAWVERLAHRLARERIGLYAALTYDGVTKWTPPDPDDPRIVDAFNRHQRTDKGFGPALGPDGGPRLVAAFEARGFAVTIAPSPWVLRSAEGPLQVALAEGVAAAAAEMGEGAAAWAQRRRDAAAAGRTSCRVGHWDVLALPD